MTNSTPSDEEFGRQITPIIFKTLLSEFPSLSDQAKKTVQQQTLVACFNIRRKAKKQRLNLALFVRRVVREQVLVWSATYGTPAQQAAAMNQIMLQNRGAVAGYLKRFRFRTTAVADEVLNDAFEAFFTNLSLQKSVKSLTSTSVISIAHYKALHQLRDERTDPTGQWAWLETTFVTVSDDDMGSLEWPLNSPEEAAANLLFQLPAAEPDKTIPVRVDIGRLRRWIADCFAKLPSKRQQLVRLRYQFWTQQELKAFSIEEIQTLFDDLSMADIATMSDYPNAHTASVRLNESRKQLRDCLTDKLTNPAAV